MAYTPFFNKLKNLLGASQEGSRSSSAILEHFEKLAHLPPDKARASIHALFQQVAEGIQSKNTPEVWEALEQFLTEAVAKSQNPEMGSALTQIKAIQNKVQKHQALIKLFLEQQLIDYFAEYWRKLFLEQNQRDQMAELLKNNLGQVNQDGKQATHQHVYNNESNLVRMFWRLIFQAVDVGLILGGQDPIFSKKPGDESLDTEFDPRPGPDGKPRLYPHAF